MENYEGNCTSNNQIGLSTELLQMDVGNIENFGANSEEEESCIFGAELRKTKSKQEIMANESFAIEADNGSTPTDSAIDSEKCDNDDKAEDHQDHEGSALADSSAASTSTDDDTSTSTDSDFSDISGLSDVSGKEWKPVNRKPILWVQKQIHSGRNPRELLSRFLPAGAQSIAMGLNDMSLWRLLANMLSEPPRRQKLRHINTFEDVIQLILCSENIVVLTGAGVSVSCGIPDFRSSDGIYSRLAKDYPNLPDPQAMFDIDYFSRDPRPFYKFAREIYPGQFRPSPCHRFIKLLEEKQRLLRNYTQNIDTLEQVAGIGRVIECHGSFSTASCTKCKFKCDAEAIRADIFAQRIPACPRCQPHVQQSVDAGDPVSEYDLRLLVANGIMKPDIVFFGEGLPEEFHKVMASDKDKCDLLIVIGSSLKVRPVALIPSSLPANVPQILINREQLNHLEFDVELLGDSDVIINQICHRLGDDWKQICYDEKILHESKELRPFDDDFEDELADSSEYIDNDEESPLMIQDADTQSVQSNISAELGFRSAGACSDSGFESSTSIGQPENLNKSNTAAALSITNYEIENIKSGLLEFDNDAAKINCEIPNDNSDDFHPFSSARAGQETLMTPSAACGDSVRHLSIDSTKDSGIQCDSSNSMVNTNALCSAESDTQFNEIETITTSNFTVPTNVKRSATSNSNSNETSSKQQHKSRPCSAADFLIEGTYYFHKNSCSYVFPGAQISWYADSDLEIDVDDLEAEAEAGDDRIRHDDVNDDLDNKCDEGNCSQDSHEYNETFAESVSPLQNDNDETYSETLAASPKNSNHSCKRRSSGDRFYKSVEEVNIQAVDESPPLKMRRTNEDLENKTTTAKAILTTATLNTNINCKEDSCLLAATSSDSTPTTTQVMNVTTTTTIQTGMGVLQEI